MSAIQTGLSNNTPVVSYQLKIFADDTSGATSPVEAIKNYASDLFKSYLENKDEKTFKVLKEACLKGMNWENRTKFFSYTKMSEELQNKINTPEPIKEKKVHKNPFASAIIIE